MPAATPTAAARLPRYTDPHQVLALVGGLVLVALGLLDPLGALVVDGLFLGVFAFPPWVNVVHVLTGLLGVVLSQYPGAGALFNKLGGVIYLVVFLVGEVGVLVGFGVNLATSGLHLLLAVVVGAVGFGLGEEHPC